MDKPKTDAVIKRLVAPLTMWALTRLLETKRARKTLQKVDARAYATRQNAAKAIQRRVDNARDNWVWLATGAAAFAVGIVLMARATRKG
jgi:hypothetical protein